MADLLITEEDNGKLVSLAIGSRVCLRLEENPTTGFQWHLREVPSSSLTLVSDEYAPNRANAVGGGGFRQYVFAAQQPGHASIELVRRRSWEDESKAQARFSVSVQIISRT